MKQKRNGFTLIEVLLFLAVTALLFGGMFGMMQNSIQQQKFNDSTQSFVEFLRRVFSAVANPQSIGDGRSDYALYGKLVTFGETYDLTGTKIENEQKFFVYDVVGDAGAIGTGDTVSMLGGVGANVIVVDGTGATATKQLAGMAEGYTPTGEASIDTLVNGQPFVGSILVVRHPRSGTITTLYYNKAMQVNEAMKNANPNTLRTFLTSKLSDFKAEELNFCVNPDGYGNKGKIRWNVKLAKNARNTSGVEITTLDGPDNSCK